MRPVAGTANLRRVAAPTPLGIAFRFGAEMISALAGRRRIGMGYRTGRSTIGRPSIRGRGERSLMFVLGAAAGIRNVMHAAQQLNAEMASKEK